jgi:hypothetical protein
MKPFFTSFLVVSLAGATAWQIGRARQPRAPDTPFQTMAPPPGDASATISPETTLARLFSARDPKVPHRNLGAREFSALASLPVESIATWMCSRPPMPHDKLWNAANVEWASRDGPAALAFALDLRARHPRTGDCACCGGNPGGQFHALVNEVYAAWLAADPAAALAHGVPPPPAEPEGSFSESAPVIETLAFHDLTSYLNLAASEPPFSLGNMASLVHTMASPYTDKGATGLIARHLALPEKRDEFSAWLNARPDPHAALGIFARVWKGVEHEPGWLQPERIPAWMPLRGKMPASLTDPKMVRFMGSLAVGAHPLEMMEASWNEADEMCAHAWAFRDPESATAWAAAQAPTADFDFALVGLAKGLGYHDPAAATAWAARIQRHGTRIRETSRHFSAWRRTDPEAASTWLEASPLSADERLALASGVQTGYWW